MSVIFGKINFQQKPIFREDLAPMLEASNHWKADEVGLWNEGPAGLGHLMLHNTPESLHEHLPYTDTVAGLTITADARLDNRDELFHKLGLTLVDMGRIPDSTLILKTYQKYGARCAEHLLGDFAFAIWDERKQQLFCGRDHMGVKPFFYYLDNHFFAFASEKKGILAIPGIDKAINKQYLVNHIVFPPEQEKHTTLYQHIHRLPPAHTLIIESGKTPILNEYWTLDAEKEFRLSSKEEYYEGLLHHFEEAVKCRTRSHFTVGSELSGGMDSSAIAGAAQRFLKEQKRELTSLSNTLPDGITDPDIIKLDERKYIDEVIRFNGITDPIYITERAFKDHIEEIDFALFVNDGLERWNPLWQIPLKKAALERNVRTLLSGFPGDELVTYRGKYHFLDYWDKKQYLKYFTAKKRFNDIHKLDPVVPASLKYFLHRIKVRLGWYSSPMVEEAYKMYNIPKTYKLNRTQGRWNDPLYRNQFQSYRHVQKYRILKPQVNQRLEAETRYGIHFRTEPRFPMADIRLTQFYLSMPNELKYLGPLSRMAFRTAMKQYLPDMLLERDSKYGSIAPFLSVDKRPKEEYTEMLLSQVPSHPILNTKEITRRAQSLPDKPKDPEKTTLKDRAERQLPPLEVLRWLEKKAESWYFNS